MKFWKFVATLAAASIVASDALAGSTVNPNVPAIKDKLNSPPIQSNFAAAYNDINNLLGKFASTTAPANPTNLQEWADLTTSPTAVFKYWNAGTATWIPYASLNTATGIYSAFSTSAGFLATPPVTVGVSGGVATYGLAFDSNFQVISNKLALTNGAPGSLLCNSGSVSAEISVCTWSGFADRAISSTNGAIPFRVGGAWGSAFTGSTGHAIPFLDASNTWSAVQTLYTGTATLRTALAGTLFRVAQVDGTAAVIQQDSFGAAGAFSCMRSDGTAASSVALGANDLICGFGAHGYDGATNSSVAAAFRLYAAQGWTASAHGTYARVATTPNGATTPVEQFGIEQDGGVTVPPTVSGGSKGAGTINVGSGYNVAGLPLNFNNLAGSSACAQLPALTGNITTVAGSCNTVIATAAVTYGMIQNVAASRLWGNPTGASAPGSEISLGATLAFLGTTLETGAGTGDVAWGANTFATTIQPAAVTFAKFQNLAALSLFGNCTNAAASGTNVTGTANQVLRVNAAGASCGFGAIDLSQAAAVTGTLQTASVPGFTGGDVTSSAGSLLLSIGANKVTNVQRAQMPPYTLKGNVTAGTANEADFTIGGLTNKSSPAGTDLVMIQDQAAGGAYKYSTLTQVIGAVATGVSSFIGRTGAVVAVAGDYAFSQISGLLNLASQVTGVLPTANGGVPQANSIYTPTVTCGIGSGTFSGQTGTYITLGKKIIVNINFTMSAIGTCSGFISVGLPVVTSSAMYGTFSAVVVSTGVVMEATGQVGGGITAARYDNAVLGLTTGNIVSMSGVYDIL